MERSNYQLDEEQTRRIANAILDRYVADGGLDPGDEDFLHELCLITNRNWGEIQAALERRWQ